MKKYELAIFVYMLTQIKKDDNEFSEIHIPVTYLHKTSKNAYNDIKDAVKGLAKKSIDIETKSKRGKREIVAIPLMKYCLYKEGNAFVVAEFNEMTKPYLLQLTGNFTVADFEQIKKLKSYYSFRIYNLLREKSYRQTVINIELQSLKEMLELSNKYQRFDNFKANVLEKAKKELSVTDMAFDYSKILRGKEVHALDFTLQKELESLEEGRREEKPNKKDTDALPPLVVELLNYGLSRNQAFNILENVDENGIKQAINLVKEKYHNSKVKNIPAYLIKVLENYQPTQYEQLVEKQRQEQQKKSENEKLFIDLIEKVKNAFDEQYLPQVVRANSRQMIENDILDFENHMKSMPHTRKKLCYDDNGKFIVLHDDYQSTLLYFLQLRGKIPSIEILFSQYFQQETGIRIKKDDTKKSGYEIVGYEPKLFFNEPSYTELVQALVENE